MITTKILRRTKQKSLEYSEIFLFNINYAHLADQTQRENFSNQSRETVMKSASQGVFQYQFSHRIQSIPMLLLALLAHCPSFP